MHRRHVLLLVAAIGVIGANSLMLSPIAGLIARSFADAVAADVMLAAAAYGAATALSALTLAPLADRLGAARVLVMALSGLSVALALAAAAPILAVVVAAQGLAGLAAGAALPAIYALAAQIAPPGRANATLSAVLTGWTLSLVAGVTGASVLATWTHWRAVVGGLALLAAVVATAVVLVRDWGDRPASGRRTSPVTAFRVPGATGVLLAVAAYMTAFYGTYSYLGPHFHGVLGASAAVIAFVPLAYGIGFGLAAPFGALLDRVRPERAAPLAFTLLASVYALISVAAESLVALVGLALAWGIVNHIGLNLMVGRLTSLDPAQRGALMGLYGAVTYAAVSLGALLFRPVFDLGGLGTCALVAAFCVVPAAVAARRWSRAAIA